MRGNPIQLIALLIAIVMPFSGTSLAHAQDTPDTRAPVIELETVARITADAAQIFTAQVVDDRQLKDVALYYRREGQQAYVSRLMNAIADSAFYTVRIETDVLDLRAIEYYIQARDESGNRTVSGFAFDPYQRELFPNTALQVTELDEPTEQSTNTDSSGNAFGLSSIRWWHVAAGVATAGVIAALSNSSSSGDSSSESVGNNEVVPLTINLTGP